MLYLVGLGLSDEKDMSLRGLEACKKADIVFFERYTSPLNINIENLSKMIGKEIVELRREDVEERNVVVKEAKNKVVAFLVPGDPLFATTHKEIVRECMLSGVEVEVIHASSILTAAGESGLSLYKFGRVVSLPFPGENYFPLSPYDHILNNLKANLHTLILLDIGMDVKTALDILLKMEEKKGNGIFNEKTKIVVLSRLGSRDKNVLYGSISKLKSIDFGKPPHCLILPAELEHHEEEFLRLIEVK